MNPNQHIAYNGKTVLIVDDNVDANDSLAELFAMFGYVTICRSDGESAMEAAQSLAPTCFVLDIALPGMDGFGVARALRQISCYMDSAIIAMSGFSGHKPLALGAGFDAFFCKPVDFEQLRLRLEATST